MLQSLATPVDLSTRNSIHSVPIRENPMASNSMSSGREHTGGSASISMIFSGILADQFLGSLEKCLGWFKVEGLRH